MNHHGHITVKPTYMPRVPERADRHTGMKPAPRKPYRRKPEPIADIIATALAGMARDYNRTHATDLHTGTPTIWKAAR